MEANSSMRTPLARVRGLGSAKAGTEHYWMLRVTSVALIFLTFIFLGLLIAMIGMPYDRARAFVANPLVAVMMLLFVTVSLYHTRIGFQTVIEDYVHEENLKTAALMANIFFTTVVGALCVFAILKIAFGG